MGLSSDSADPKRAFHWAETFRVVAGAALAAGTTAFAEPRCVNFVSMSNCQRPRCRRGTLSLLLWAMTGHVEPHGDFRSPALIRRGIEERPLCTPERTAAGTKLGGW
jgi:hypothetical protein